MIAHFDKATEKWFREHPHNETTVMQCDKCGLFYKPSLEHNCKPKKVCDLKNKCGSCIFSKPTNWGRKLSKTYVECTNEEHTKKYCRNDTARKRAKTTPACKSYRERIEKGGEG